MKTKQDKLKAKLPLTSHEIENGAYCYEKEKRASYKIIDKVTEKTIVSCTVSMARSASASTVYADLWVSHIKENKIPKNSDYSYSIENTYNPDKPYTGIANSLSGKGRAGGYGYDKESAAIQDAIDACGIILYGTPYRAQVADFKKRASIGGTGEHESALLAIAYACGYNNCILVRL
jgi:hypothetical protein